MYRSRHRKAINAPGHAHELTFSCYRKLQLLAKPRCCEWLAESIEAARRVLGFQLWAYVFMPDHVHLIVRPSDEKHDMAEILQKIKRPVSRRALAWLDENAPEWIERLTATRGTRTERHFWQRGGGYDRNITEARTLESMIDYLHLNPIRQGLVERATDWQWSSAGWFAGERQNTLRPDPLPPEWTVDVGISSR